MKSAMTRITENTPQYQGVVVCSTSDVPLVSKLYFNRELKTFYLYLFKDSPFSFMLIRCHVIFNFFTEILSFFDMTFSI